CATDRGAGRGACQPPRRVAYPSRDMGGIRRAIVLLVANLAAAALASCSKPSSAKPSQGDPPRSASAPAPAAAGNAAPAPAPAKADDDLAERQQVLDIVEHSNALMMKPYEDEQRRLADKTARLDKLIDDTEALIDAGDLDRAELKAAAIHWEPDATRGDLSEP